MSLVSHPNYPRKASLISLPYFSTILFSHYFVLPLLFSPSLSSPLLSSTLFSSLPLFSFPSFPFLPYLSFLPPFSSLIQMVSGMEKQEGVVVLLSLRSAMHSIIWSSVYTWSSALPCFCPVEDSDSFPGPQTCKGTCKHRTQLNQ